MAQIGTIQLQTASSGVVDVPVFETADAGSDVFTMWRVQTDSGVGFIPLVDPADAKYDYIRVGTENNGIVCPHNESSLFTPAIWTISVVSGKLIKRDGTDGSLLWSKTISEYNIESMSVTPSGKTYIGDANGYVFEYDTNGNKINEFDYDVAQFSDGIVGVAVSESDFIYTAFDNSTVEKRDTNYNLLWTYDGNGNYSKPFGAAPRPFHVDGNDNLISAAPSSLTKITSNGTTDWKRESGLGGDTGEKTIEDIAVNHNGEIWLSTDEEEVWRINKSDGSTIWEWQNPYNTSNIYSATIGKDEKVIVGDGDGSIYQLDSNGNKINEMREVFGDTTNVDNISIDPQGYVYGWGNNELKKIKPDFSGTVWSITTTDTELPFSFPGEVGAFPSEW